MNLHDSPATMTSNKEVDQLVTPHSASYCLKRPHPEHSDSHQFETKRKLVHLNNQNQDTNTVTPPRRKQDPLKSQKHLQMLQKEQIVVEEESKDPLLTIPLREKYAHLIPDYQSAEYTAEERMLLRVQTKLDEHLVYLKTHRGRKQGDFFKRCHIIVELIHLKQILSIDSRLYICSREKDKDCNMDILVDLPGNIDLQSRKIEFKQKLYSFLSRNGAFENNRAKNVRIPFFKFDFEEKIQKNNEKALKQLRQSQEEGRKEECKLTLQNMFCKDFKFKEALYQKIVEKENKIKEQARLAETTKLYNQNDVLKVLDQVHLAYSAKRICNMFRATLIEIITKKVPLQDHLLSEVLQLICEKTPTYLKKVSHNKGLILQIDKGCYNAARSCIKQLSI